MNHVHLSGVVQSTWIEGDHLYAWIQTPPGAIHGDDEPALHEYSGIIVTLPANAHFDPELRRGGLLTVQGRLRGRILDQSLAEQLPGTREGELPLTATDITLFWEMLWHEIEVVVDWWHAGGFILPSGEEL